MQFTRVFAAALLAGTSVLAIAPAYAGPADNAASNDAPKKHHHHAATGTDRLDLLEHQLQLQSEAIKAQSDEIQSLKAQLGPQSASQAVSAQDFSALQSQVAAVETERKDEAPVKFTHQTPVQRGKTQPTISSRDGKWTLSLYAMVQGDYASYSKGQPLSQPGTDNLKSSGENFRRARIGFNGTLDRDFSYSFIYDFGGANGDETYQGYGAPNSGSTKNASGSSITPYTTSTGAGTGPHIYNAWIGYKGILDPFTFKAGLMATPANLGDATQSDDLWFNERPSPSQLSRGLDGDDGRESAGFIGNGDNWNASLFLSGDTYGKAALVAPATTYGGSQEAVVGRAVFLPWRDADSNLNVHLGANFGYVIHPPEATSTANPGVTTYPITFSDRPELRVDNVTFINTGAVNARSAYTAGLEAAASYGAFTLQGENYWYGIERNNPAAGVTDPSFSGWYVEGSWVLTGEGHPYNTAYGSFARPSPAETFDPASGAWGAWEIVGRYSAVDFDYDTTSKTSADRLFGGKQYIASAGLNFYPNDALRFVLDWQDVELRDIGALNDNGHYQTVSVRAQVSF